AQFDGQRRGKDKAAGLGRDNSVDLFAAVGLGEAADDFLERRWRCEQGGNVPEQDSGLGKIGDVPNEFFQIQGSFTAHVSRLQPGRFRKSSANIGSAACWR